jgi:hypothetical protein
MHRRLVRSAGLIALSACAPAGAQAPVTTPPPAPAAPAATSPRTAGTDTLSFDRPQYVSTYRRRPNPPVLIRNATLLTATGQEIPGGSILFRDGRIVALEPGSRRLRTQ